MLSRVVAKLVDDGLATRLPNPADQRAIQLEATDAGHEMHLRIIRSRTETVARILDGLSPDVTDALHDALPALEALAEGLRGQKS
jgi:DNA-binding MarR family transcriptional regulator